MTNAQPLHQQLNEARNQSFVQLLAQMKSVIGSNYEKDQSFVQALVHEDPTIEKDDSKEVDSENNDSHNNDDSYSIYQTTLILIQKLMFTKMLALETILLKEVVDLGKREILLKQKLELATFLLIQLIKM